MATIKKVDVTKSEYNGKEKTNYKFTLSDGKIGFVSNKPWEFKEGDEVNYTTEVKKSPKGEYNLFTFVRIQGSAPAPTPAPSPNKETKQSFDRPMTPPTGAMPSVDIRLLKVDAAKTALEIVMENYRVEKVKPEEVTTKFKEAAILLYNEIDDIFSDK